MLGCVHPIEDPLTLPVPFIAFLQFLIKLSLCQKTSPLKIVALLMFSVLSQLSTMKAEAVGSGAEQPGLYRGLDRHLQVSRCLTGTSKELASFEHNKCCSIGPIRDHKGNLLLS